jgi:ketol-acid reductoisomerase
MERLFDRIESGDFAKAWLAEKRAGNTELSRLRERERALLLEKVGSEIRERAGGTIRPARAPTKKG